jgi:hypothetical protein
LDRVELVVLVVQWGEWVEPRHSAPFLSVAVVEVVLVLLQHLPNHRETLLLMVVVVVVAIRELPLLHP